MRWPWRKREYMYFIAYSYSNGGVSGTGSVWHRRTAPIVDAASEALSRDLIASTRPELGTVVITNFILAGRP